MKSKGKQENSNKLLTSFILVLRNHHNAFYFLHFNSPLISVSDQCLKCKCVCEAREGFLLPCNYFPFPPFSISSAFSQTICVALYRFHTTQSCTPSKLSFRKPLRVEGGGPRDPRGLNPFVSTEYMTATVPRGTSSMSLNSTQINMKRETHL